MTKIFTTTIAALWALGVLSAVGYSTRVARRMPPHVAIGITR